MHWTYCLFYSEQFRYETLSKNCWYRARQHYRNRARERERDWGRECAPQRVSRALCSMPMPMPMPMPRPHPMPKYWKAQQPPKKCPSPSPRSATLAHSYPGEACLASKTNFWLSSSMPSCLNLVECVASFPLPLVTAIPLALLCFMTIMIVREKWNDLERYLHLSSLANMNSFLVPGTLAI